MKTLVTIFIILLLSPATSFAADILRTDTGYYYPGDMKHKDSLYYGYGDANPNFGNRCHLANDYDLIKGSPVYAVDFGVVEQVSTNIPFYGSDSGAVGGAIIIKHTTLDNKDFYALYGHIDNFKVSVGDMVKGGDQIADVGQFLSNGNPLPHLHFGINSSGPSYEGYTPSSQCSDYKNFVDPEEFLTSNKANVTAAESCQAKDDKASTVKNIIVTISSVLANDSDVNGDTLAVSAADATSANGVTVTNNTDGTFTYTPTIDFVGKDSFNYTLTDNNGCTDQGKVTITVKSDDDDDSSGGSLGLLGVFTLLLLLSVQVLRRRVLKVKF